MSSSVSLHKRVSTSLNKSPNTQKTLSPSCQSSNFSPLYLSSHKLSQSDNKPVNSHPCSENKRFPKNYSTTSLMLAVQNGDLDAVHEEIRKNPNCVHTQEKPNKMTALMYAAESGNYKAVETLLLAGARPNLKTYYTEETALQLALEDRNIRKQELLVFQSYLSVEQKEDLSLVFSKLKEVGVSLKYSNVRFIIKDEQSSLAALKESEILLESIHDTDKVKITFCSRELNESQLLALKWSECIVDLDKTILILQQAPKKTFFQSCIPSCFKPV